MLEEDLEWSVPDDLVEAFQAYSDAVVLLDDTFAGIEAISLPTRAGQALPLLDTAASYVLRAPFAPEDLVSLAASADPQRRIDLRTAASSARTS